MSDELEKARADLAGVNARLQLAIEALSSVAVTARDTQAYLRGLSPDCSTALRKLEEICEHAKWAIDECPQMCPCPAGCYCKTRTCKERAPAPTDVERLRDLLRRWFVGIGGDDARRRHRSEVFEILRVGVKHAWFEDQDETYCTVCRQRYSPERDLAGCSPHV